MPDFADLWISAFFEIFWVISAICPNPRRIFFFHMGGFPGIFWKRNAYLYPIYNEITYVFASKRELKLFLDNIIAIFRGNGFQ